ncbi:MAG TPA: peptidoglycan-binding domain-containing protein [Blastocatellia bacterium]|nr:peptidoglycan-binding domain-containing protein [Blastocatellia bacterium]
MKQSRIYRKVALFVFSFILILALASPGTFAKAKHPSRSRGSRGRASRSRGRGGRSARGGRSSRGGRVVYRRIHGRTVAVHTGGGGGRLVPLRDSRGRVKRDRRGRIMYARVAPPKPKPGAEIPSNRVVEIQHALTSQGFYKGEENGTYDDATKTAMQSFQSAHGMKPTGLPTAQALKLLGLTKSTASNTTSTTDAPSTRPRTVTKKNP